MPIHDIRALQAQQAPQTSSLADLVSPLPTGGGALPSPVLPASPQGGQLPVGGHEGHGDHQNGDMDPAAAAAWAKLGQMYPSLKPTSMYRSPAHNHSVGGASGSLHMKGQAYDGSWASMSQPERIAFLQAAQNAGFRGFGVYNNSFHADVGAPRVWGSSYKRDSAPAWAINALGY